jgi:N-acetylglucosamine repressor
MNERQVLRVIQDRGPSSRAEVVRYSGISAPTVSKAVSSLLRSGLLEEDAAEAPELGRGRPTKRLRLAIAGTQVLGVVIDASWCWIVSAGLDGGLRPDRMRKVPTPTGYQALIDTLAEEASVLMAVPGVATLGMGISMPGLIDYRRGMGLLSPNVHATDGRTPARDLSDRLGLDCVLLQESHALCLAEREYGSARGLDDFAMLDVSTGVGMGVYSGGRLLRGHSGFAGEIGHITVDPVGAPCGCGNRGCLETFVSDTAFVRMVGRRVNRPIDIDEAIRLVREGEVDVSAEFATIGRYLAIGLAAVINIFNPSNLFVFGRLFDADDHLFPDVLRQTGERALGPSLADCRIIQARGSKRQGAIAGIIRHLTDSLAPTLD